MMILFNNLNNLYIFIIIQIKSLEMKKEKGQTPQKSNIDIRSMFLAGVPKIINNTQLAVKQSKKEEEKTQGRKRKAEEAYYLMK